MIYAWIKLGLPLTVLPDFEIIVALITASLFMMALQNAAAASCFWIQNSFWLLDISFKMKDYAKYPSLVILRPDEVPVLTWLSPVLGVLAFYLSYKLWMKGASKYDGSGS